MGVLLLSNFPPADSSLIDEHEEDGAGDEREAAL